MTARPPSPAWIALVLAAACRRDAAPVPASTAEGLAAPPPARSSALAQVCARVASCAHPHDPQEWRNPSACVDALLSGEHEELARCLASAPQATCAPVTACIHPNHPAGPGTAFCAAHPGAMTGCEGATLIACGDDDPAEATATDCAAFGAKCGAIVQPGGLRTHACVDGARCPPELTRASCEGTGAVLSCHDGEIERSACPPGSTCRAHTDGDGEQIAMCEAPGHTSCASPGSSRCDGARLVTCEAHGHFGHEHAVDCAAAGLVCARADAGASCASANPECRGGHPVCEGSALSFCAAGVRVRVDCGSIGFGACEADGRGPDATCRPGLAGGGR